MKIEEYLIDYFPFEKSEIIDFLNEKAKQGLKIYFFCNGRSFKYLSRRSSR